MNADYFHNVLCFLRFDFGRSRLVHMLCTLVHFVCHGLGDRSHLQCGTYPSPFTLASYFLFPEDTGSLVLE